MTALVALAPLAVTPLIVWLLLVLGPERGVLLALYWLIPSIVFAIAMPVIRRRGRSLAQASARGVVWAIVITIVVFVGLFVALTARVGAQPVGGSWADAQRPDTAVKVPVAGSAIRTAILDAVRSHVGVGSRFKVTHIRATDRWAFVRCVEVIEDGTQLQETDLDVAGLLARRPAARVARWEVVELWALTTDQERPYATFARRVRQRARDAHLPQALFPVGFLTSDVPVR